MSVTKRGSSFQATVHFKGERYRKTFPTNAEALAWETKTLALLKEGKAIDLEDSPGGDNGYGSMTLGGLLELTYSRFWKGTRGERTALINAKKCVEFLGEHVPPYTVNEAKLDKLIFAFEQEGVSDSTINRRLSALSKMLSVAYDRGIIQRRPKFDRKKEPEHRNRFITPEEEGELLGIFSVLGHQDMLDFAILGIDTGLRAGELLRTTARHVMDGALYVDFTKTNLPRTVPLTDRAKGVIERRLAANKGKTDKLFPDFTYDMARHYWDVARSKMGLARDQNFVIHVMRHTFCSRLIMSGVDVSEVARLAGHTNVAVTMRYISLSPKSLKSAIEKMQESMRGTNNFQLPNTALDCNLQSRHTPQVVA